MMTNGDYAGSWFACKITTDERKHVILDDICSIILKNQGLYALVGKACQIPWQAIAGIHFRESNQSFSKHLHNGDPLTARTVHVPVGRPDWGQPPYQWKDSAIDAIRGSWRPREWNIGTCLEWCERYNGLGYQKHSVNSPYLWDWTSLYDAGLFTADGHFDAQAKEDRPGVVAILKWLIQKGVKLDFASMDGPDSSMH